MCQKYVRIQLTTRKFPFFLDNLFTVLSWFGLMHICWVRKKILEQIRTYVLTHANKIFEGNFSAGSKPTMRWSWYWSLHSFRMHRTSAKTMETVVFIVWLMTTATMMIWLNSSFCVYTWNCMQGIRTMGKVKWTSFEHEIQRKHTFHSLMFFFFHTFIIIQRSWLPVFLHISCIGLCFCYCVSGVRCRLERKVLHAVTHWRALGPTRHATHRISFDGEPMATSPPVRQQYINDLCSLNQDNKYMSLASVPGLDCIRTPTLRASVYSIVHLVHCAERPNEKEFYDFLLRSFSFGVVRFECCIDKRCKHVTLLDKNLIKWKRDFMVFI